MAVASLEPTLSASPEATNVASALTLLLPALTPAPEPSARTDAVATTAEVPTDVPVSGTIGPGQRLAFGQGCVPVSFAALRLGGLQLGRTQLPVCAVGQAVVFRQPDGDVAVRAFTRNLALNGRLGSSPFAARAVRGALVGSRGFEFTTVAARLGNPDAPILLNPDDRVIWNLTYPDREPDGEITDGETFTIAGIDLRAIHTPGHSPGSTVFYAPDIGTLFSGDTLFQGGPGATGRSHSDFPTIVESIRTRVLSLPEATVVLTGHGDPTRVGDEAPHLQEWITRGH